MTTELRLQPHLLTVSEYADLGEPAYGYTELVEGRLLHTPSPLADHNWAAAELRDQLRAQLPPGLEVIIGIDVDLALVPPDGPGFSRRPDLVVVSRDARLRQRREGGLLRASEVVVVVEVVSPSSRRTDHVAKRSEYADAGIPHYWVVDLADPVSLLVFHQAGDFGYADGGPVTGTFRGTEPFPVEVDLDALL